MQSRKELILQHLTFHLVLALDGIRVGASAVGEDTTSNETFSNEDGPFGEC